MTIDKLKTIFETVIPNVDTSKITMDTQLQQDLGITSLSMLLLALAIEKEFDFRFDTMQPFQTVGEVVNYIEKKTKK